MVFGGLFLNRLRPYRWIIVVENEGRRIGRIALTASPNVARTKITRRIVSRLATFRRSFDLALPGTLRAMRRNQHPLARQHIQAAMRRVAKGRHCSATILDLNCDTSYTEPILMQNRCIALLKNRTSPLRSSSDINLWTNLSCALIALNNSLAEPQSFFTLNQIDRTPAESAACHASPVSSRDTFRQFDHEV